jgi:hypothetical protein
MWPRRTTDGRSSMAAWLNRITVSANWANTVKLAVSAPASITPNPNGPNAIPNPTKINAGAMYHRFTSPETTA